jgi:anti-anti-sigma factor
MMSSVAIVSAYGDIDGTNADTLTEHAFAETARYSALILDLSELEFFGTDGFSALHRISVDCAHVGKSWMMVPGAAVERLLRICDPHGSLPTADSVGAALTSILTSASFRRCADAPCASSSSRPVPRPPTAIAGSR